MSNPYPYHPYPQYQYQQWQYNQPIIPQGDPATALNHMMYPPYPYYQEYYGYYDNQRPMINYNDIHSYYSDPYQTTPTPTAPPPAAAPPPEQIKICCRKILKSSIALAQHEKLHIPCPSCDKTCLPSYLKEHEEIFHGKKPEKDSQKQHRPDGIVPPNAPRINTPEELAAWISARKKNWPTQENQEKKRAEVEVKKSRIEKRKADVLVDYGSDSENEIITDKDAVTSKDPSAIGHISLPEEKPKPRRLCMFFKKGFCKYGDQCAFSHEIPKPKPKGPPPKKKNRNLLYKLLEKEIRQESSVILQCIRYIVDNDYFDINK